MARIDQLAKEAVQPILKKVGFRKRRHLWNRQRSSFIDVVDIQKGKGNSPGFESFTVNIGVFVPEFYKAVWQKSYGTFVQEVDCPVRLRIGELLQDGSAAEKHDIWWKLEADTDVVSVSQEIGTIIEHRVLRFFDSIKNFKDVTSFVENLTGWRRDEPLTQIYYALTKKKLGEVEACLDILDSIAHGKSKGWAARAEMVKQSIEGVN